MNRSSNLSREDRAIELRRFIDERLERTRERDKRDKRSRRASKLLASSAKEKGENRAVPSSSASRVSKPRRTRTSGRIAAALRQHTSPSSPPGKNIITDVERMIRVFVNNRLGAKAEVICSPSDTVGEFKTLAAMKLGVDAGAILLKRQGQRPLKNALTLQDYEIGDGVQLELEVDTTG